MALPRGTTGSLDPTFVPARLVSLTVKPAYALALHSGFPIHLSRSLRGSATADGAISTVKLPVWPCLPARHGWKVRATVQSGYLPIALPYEAGPVVSPVFAYATQIEPLLMT